MRQAFLLSIFLLTILSSSAQTWTWKSVNNQGMGYVTGMIIHPDAKNASDLIYVRTDVGGAYRFDAANQKWIQLMDFANSLQMGYFQVESMAIDLQNPDIVYAAVDGSNGEGGDILKSTDRGVSWKSTGMVDNNIYIAGNDPWRGSSGERLMVDPNNSEIIYFGSRKNGLWRKEGVGNWTTVGAGLPTAPLNPGYTFVLFDPASSDGRKSKTIYAGCYGSGVWKTDDSGASWNNLNGGTNCLRATLASDKTLFVSYGGHEQEYQGPGKVAKYANGTWNTITPPSGTSVGYSGITSDPNDPDCVAVTTNQRIMYYSKNKGTSWTLINSAFQSNSYPSYYNAGDNSFNWGTAALVIDPNNTNRLWSTNGYGVVKNENYTLQSANWVALMNNLEELCVTAISTPPLEGGADLFTVGMDMVGMRNANRDIAPTSKITTFPYVSRGTSIEYCQTKPNHIVFLGVDQTNETDSYYGYSTDNGLTWNKFNNAPGKGGKLVISSTNEKNWVWTPDGATTKPQYTMDAGKTWIPCKGITGHSHQSGWGLMNYLAADKVNGRKFYYTDNGKLYYSEDGGANWSTGYSGLPGWPQNMFLKTHPYHEGELWYTAMTNGINSKTQVYISKDGGKSFSVLTNMVFANNIAFGKGDNNSIPFIYLSGKVDADGPEGIFKSEDEGKTWKLISDPKNLQVAIVLEADMRDKNLVYTGRGICRGVTFGTLDPTVGFDELKNQDKSLKVFPNPADDKITIQSNDMISLVSIFDMMGRTIMEIKINDYSASISVSKMEQGCYLIRAQTANGSKVIELVKK